MIAVLVVKETTFFHIFVRKRKKIAKLDSFVLKKNGIDILFFSFVQKQKAIEYGYVNILKQTENSIVLKLTEKGELHYKYNSKHYRVRVPTYLERMMSIIVKILSKFFSFLVQDIPYYLKVFSESWVVKFILFLVAILTFILKWKDIKEFIHVITQ